MTLVGEDQKHIKTHKVIRMEGEACMYDKFGFCKFKATCKRQHYSQTCEHLSACKTIKSCLKRHPKTCKWFAKDVKCSFGIDCGYSHTNPTVNPEKESMKKKVEYLENIVQEMAIKIIQLEIDLDGFKMNGNKKGSEVEQEQEITNQVCIKKSPEVKIQDYNDEDKIQNFSCNMCNYKCKKKNTLKKHNKSKHNDHKCSTCDMTFKTFNEVTRHNEQHHSSNKREKENVKTPENNLEASEKDFQDTSFVYSESMLDEFDKSGNQLEDSEVDKLLEEFGV